jgi:autotransporter-associated beta strand protein
VQAAAVSGRRGDAAVIFNHTDSAAVFSPFLAGSRRVEHRGAGTTILTNVNQYSGGTRIVNGTLRLGTDDALGEGPVTMEGGTLDLDDFSQYQGDEWATTFTLAGDAFIDFSGGGNLLYFADSSALEWSGSLTIIGFTAGDHLSFGSSDTGLTPEQLAMINFDGYTALIGIDGSLSASTTAIPEPSTYALLAGAGTLGLALLRRRLGPRFSGRNSGGIARSPATT